MAYILYKYAIIYITLKPVELQGIDSQIATPLLLKLQNKKYNSTYKIRNILAD